MTRVVSAIVLSSLAFSALAACTKATPAADQKSDVDAIKAVEDGMRDAYKAKDAAKLVAQYAPDATLYVPSQRPATGTEALTENAKAELDDPAFHLTFTTAKAAASGDMGYTQGSFTIRYTDPGTKEPTSYSGYYLTVFRKQADGSWKAVEDMALPANAAVP